MGVNWDEWINNTGGSDNRHHSQVEFGNEGGNDYQDDWAYQPCDVMYAGESIDSPIVLDWGEIENYGAYSEVGDIF